MKFKIDTEPPTATAQEKKIRIVNGSPIFYEPPKLKAARKLLTAYLNLYKPKKPMQGPVLLKTRWLFPKGRHHKAGEWRITRPDTDNLQKMLKDCMTRCGFWNDDAQVCREEVEKLWDDEPGGIEIEIHQLEEYHE